MAVILELLQKDHPDVMSIKDEYKPIYDNSKIVLSDLIKDSKKLLGETTSFLNMFNNIIKVDPDAEDLKFGKTLKRSLATYKDETDALVSKIEKVPAM
jgi:hypothetical protein